MCKFRFSQALIIFWGLWFLIVSTTDTINFFQVLGFVPVTFPFTSRNFELLNQFTQIYGISFALNFLVFAIVIAWSWTVTILFGRWLLDVEGQGFEKGILALSVGTVMTLAFIITDELFIQYEAEHIHLIRLIAQLASLVFVYVDRSRENLLEESKF